MTFRVVTFPLNEVEEQAERLTTPDDYVRLSLDRDPEPILEVCGG